MKALGWVFIVFGAIMTLGSLGVMFSTGNYEGGLMSAVMFGIAPIGIGFLCFRSAEKMKIAKAELLEKKRLAEVEEERRKQEYIENLIERFGEDGAHRIVYGKLQIGDTKDFVKAAFGDPVNTDQAVSKTKIKDIWKYLPAARDTYKLKITFENDEVASWDDKR